MLVIFILSISTSFAGPLYYGANSTESILKFVAKIETSLTANVNDKIHMQLQHLIGHFHSKSFIANFGFTGVLGDQYDYKIIKTERKPKKKITTYQFKGKVNFDKRSFDRKKFIDVPILLPLNLDNIYKLGVVNGVNRCSDKTYNAEEDFFYFWDICMSGCPLKNDQVNIVRVTGELEKLDNTKLTYPEYDRLYANKMLKIAVFLGYIDDTPGKKSDFAFDLYHELQDELKTRGFETKSEQKAYHANADKGHSYKVVMTMNRKTELGNNQKFEITLLLADTALASDDETFQTEYASALKSSHLIAYDGHSGLGANLGVDYLPEFSFGRIYQILFLNGCSSYPYFNSQYFDQKPGGSKNLEIITSGLPTLTSTSFTNMMAFLSPFIEGKTLSYQRIMKGIEDSNDGEDTYLMGVNGDEDNQFKP